MSKPNSEIKFAIVKASYWVGDATEYGSVYWLLEMIGKWTEEFEAAHFFDTRSAAELRLAQENQASENPHCSIIEVELYHD
ncbi:hypothetical protein [Microcoleus sp. BROC3]|uniref:hypothetical protein n=1 Tax=Microcoleus sp. BROC3 TaxID=3055323 RepID=UPI002FD27E75